MTVDPIAKLLADLEVALQSYTKVDRTLGSVEAVGAAFKFLKALGVEARLLTPLTSIMMTATDSKKTNAKKPLADSLPLVAGAAALDVLINGQRNQPLKAVAAKVAKALHKRVNAQQLIYFKGNLGKGRASPEALASYGRQLANLHPFRELPQAVREKVVLKALTKITDPGATG